MQGVAARGGSKTQTKVLTKQAGERLGLSLISLNPGASGNIYVSSIAPNSTAYRKKVGVGWELLYVNGKNVENMTVDDIARLAGGSCKEVEIIFETTMAERFVKWKAEAGTKAPPAATAGAATAIKPKPNGNSAHKTVPNPHPPSQAKHKPVKVTKRPVSSASAEQNAQGPTADEDSGGDAHKVAPKKKKAAAQSHNTIQRFLQSSRSSDPSGSPAANVHHPLHELTRAQKSRQAMLVDKLTYMGFSKADAVLSCEKCGIDNIDANMLWLVSMVEERRFQNELNKAQIESELQKRSEDSQHKQKEQEVLQTASSLRELFPDSVVFDPVTQAPLVIHLIETFLVKLNDTAIPLRQAVVDILTQEAKARRWYPRPAQCYIANLVQRVNSTISSHPPTAACCARRDANECPLVTIVQTELATLKSHLYMSTSNVGGVPLAFLEADDENRFSLADDGFEVCNVEDLVSDDDE
ncbi:hypothetical protein H310_04096 [Aphanomyces invadans]|uniref:PDZ domain-containing protein n=1 Tax=Aphanomyces invadans TaxID=157072 RepID=A0A024UFK2_9STRA|nr:hypothetical protein H310_04096 [Aphanomyces invadans]ETW05059.1 hypothetical protein H310_04096 [Aphanomyces invadans]|eukprot:XP_008866497.1 hypothetical protein H310_04096 [Aphanomyces invadans]